jgi:hypothetical protein
MEIAFLGIGGRLENSVRIVSPSRVRSRHFGDVIAMYLGVDVDQWFPVIVGWEGNSGRIYWFDFFGLWTISTTASKAQILWIPRGVVGDM